MTYLTAATQDTKATTYRYYAELASPERDYEGLATDYKIVDVVVTEDSRSAIQALIDACGWLKGWTLVNWWSPAKDSMDDAPF